jgi:hypothetical protein
MSPTTARRKLGNARPVDLAVSQDFESKLSRQLRDRSRWMGVLSAQHWKAKIAGCKEHG